MIQQARTNRRLAVCLLLVCLNLVFIWGNSLLPGNVSGLLSSEVKQWLLELFPGLAGTGSEGGHTIRKIAHFLEFCCLGMCLRSLARLRERPPVQQLLLPWVGGVLAACADETIQRFVPGRGPALLDVGIDTLGVTLGVGIISLIYYCKAKKQNNLEETEK